MRCPLCDVSTKEVERRGVLIDVCPECRGVWLDRGEPDKLLANVGGHEEEASYDENPTWKGTHHKARKHRSLLKEIFDFDLFD